MRWLTFEPAARFPARSGLALEVVGGLVAHQLEGVTAFDQRLAFGDEALQFDGFDLAAILFALKAALRLAHCRPVRVRSAQWRGERG